MYMSYCRFEGTLNELRACMGNAEEHANGEAEYAVSENEIRKFRQMVQEFHGWMVDMALIDEYGDLNEDELDGICEAMAKSYSREDESDE